jgi:hypothetical protein
VDRVVQARNGDQLHRLEHDRVGERSERLWHVEGSRDRSDKLAVLLIDCEVDRRLGAVVVGMLREMERLSVFEEVLSELTSGVPHASMERWKPSQDRSLDPGAVDSEEALNAPYA